MDWLDKTGIELPNNDRLHGADQLPTVTTGANPVLEVMEPVQISDNNIAFHNLGYNLHCSVTIDAYTKIFNDPNWAP